MSWEIAAAATSVFSGLKGLFGSKPKQPNPRDNLLSQAKGARDAAAKYGFNPLTMLQYGQPGGAMAAGGGAPPLASIDAITEGLRGFDDVFSGDAARRRQADQLELDLARLKLDQARSGVISGPVASDAIGPAPSPLGRRAVQVPNGGAVHSAPRPALNRPPVHPRSANNEMIPVTWTDGKPSYIPRGVAERLDVKPFGNLVAGDLEELRGELVGGAENTIRAADVVRYQGNGTPLGQNVERPAIQFGGESTAELYERIFGPDHPATKKAKQEESK